MDKIELNDDWYYSDREYITNSMLGWVFSSPAYLYKKLYGKVEEEEESYYEFGRAVHMRLLEPALFAKTYYVPKYHRPVNSTQRMFCDFLISTEEKIDDEALISAYKLSYSTKAESDTAILKKAKKLYDTNLYYIEEVKANSDKVFLSQSDYKRIKKIENNVSKHKRAASLIYGSGDGDITSDLFNEEIILFKGKDGIKMKSKIDKFIIDYNNKEVTIVEFKTHSVLREDQNMKETFLKSFKKFNYDRQLFVYFLAVSYFIKEKLKMNPEDFKFNFKAVVAKSNFDNEVRVFSINDRFIDEGAKKFDEALDAFYHYKTFGFDYPYGINDKLEEELKP